MSVTVQICPLFEDENTPSSVPAKMVFPIRAIALMSLFVKPAFTESQLIPLFVDKYIPPPQVPAKMLLPYTANEMTSVLSRLVCCHCAFAIIDRLANDNMNNSFFINLTFYLLHTTCL